MIYIYDILLNFNNEFYEFYEWEKSDLLFHTKKIPIYKVETKVIEDFLTKKVIIDSPLLLEIYNKTEMFDNKKVKTIPYAFLLTDSYRVIGVLLNEDHVVIKISDLLLDEEEDAREISKRCNFKELTYNIIGSRKNHYFLTRRETKIKKYLQLEIKNAHQTNDILRLEYLYFELFNKNCLDKDKIYQELMESLQSEITEKHIKLFEIMKLYSANKKLPNLTN